MSRTEALGLLDTNLNTLSTQTPRGPKITWIYILTKEEWQTKMMAAFFFIAHENGFKFHAQPQTGAYSCSIYARCDGHVI